MATHKREACVFKNLHSGEHFRKDAFLVTVLTGFVWIGASKVKLNQATSCLGSGRWAKLMYFIYVYTIEDFAFLVVHVSQSAFQSQFTEQFFNTSRCTDTKNDQKCLSLTPLHSFKSIDLIKVMLEDAVSKRMVFKEFLLSLINLLTNQD